MTMYYTGIGCREHGLTAEQTEAITRIGRLLSRAKYHLRSGHASGSDYAFEQGAAGARVLTSIYLPWSGFRTGHDLEDVNYYTLSDKAFQFARNQLKKSGVMPYFDSMNRTNQAFHARNVFQVLGREKIKSDFVVYFAPLGPMGEVLGGTRTAVDLAERLGIPTYNLKEACECLQFMKKLDKMHDNQITSQVKGLYEGLIGGV